MARLDRKMLFRKYQVFKILRFQNVLPHVKCQKDIFWCYLTSPIIIFSKNTSNVF